MRYYRSIIMIIFFCISTVSFAKNPFLDVKVSKKELKKRKEIVVRKNGKAIGLKKIDEAHLVPGLLKFIQQLRMIIKNKDLNQLKKHFSKNIRCKYAYHDYYNGSVGIDKCIHELKIIENGKFWDHIAPSLDAGGCVLGGQYVMPSIITCDLSIKELNEIDDKKFIGNKIIIYKNPVESSEHQTFPENYFFRTQSVASKECRKVNSDINCDSRWNRFTSVLTGDGWYVPHKSVYNNSYEYSIYVGYEEGEFKIMTFGSLFLMM